MLKFCFEVGETAAETHSMLYEACSDDASSQMTTCEWSKHFKNGGLADLQLQDPNF